MKIEVKTFRAQLKEMSACDDARRWVADQTLAQAWAACDRGDWMLWLAARTEVDRKLIVLAACACARPVLAFVQADKRPRVAIETAERWARGEPVTLADVRAAADAAAYNASSGYNASSAAASAAYAAYADYYDHAAYAAEASACVAATAIASASASARLASLAHGAELVRSMIPLEALAKATPTARVQSAGLRTAGARKA